MSDVFKMMIRLKFNKSLKSIQHMVKNTKQYHKIWGKQKRMLMNLTSVSYKAIKLNIYQKFV